MPPRPVLVFTRDALDVMQDETYRASVAPRRVQLTTDMTARLRVREQCGVAGCEWCGRRLKPLQSESLCEIERVCGLLGPIGVGHGKTAIALLTPVVLGAAVAVILTKPTLIPALLETQAMMERHFNLVPVRVMSYAALSRKGQTDALDKLGQEFDPAKIVIVADEAHKLGNPTSSTTMRVLRFFKDHPGARFVALSGTMTSKSVKQYAHLSELALREGSPLPRPSRGRGAVSLWSQVFDVDGKPGAVEWKNMAPLLNTFGEHVPGGGQYKLSGAVRMAWARRALQARLRSTAGVVCSEEGSLGSSLEIRILRHPEPPPAIEAALRRLAEDGLDPEGNAPASDLDAWQTGRELSAGFFQRWIWPGGVVDTEWMTARSEWNRRVRAELQRRSRAGYDSPLLVWNETKRRVAAGEADDLCHAWSVWNDIRDRVSPTPLETWIDTYLVEHAVRFAWGLEEPVIVWYGSLPVERALRKLGLPVYGSGTRIPEAPPGRTIAASWKAHSDGCNLQHAWSRNLFLEPPSGGKAWEQTIGRTHRPGQEADEVVAYAYGHTEPFRQALRAARKDARYVEDTTGNAQKLNFATFSDYAEGADV